METLFDTGLDTPTLYKKTSTGAIQEWTIRVEGSTIITRYGQVGGRMQEASDTVTEGKNVGRVNETTPRYQARLEAFAQWEKKRKKHYRLSIEDAINDIVDEEVIAGGIVPMLAHKYSEQGQKITFPALVQPKLDGHRCIAVIKDGKCTLWSRTQKPILGVPHIQRALERIVGDDAVLDGELYSHDYRDKFEQLSSFIKQVNPKPGHEVVQYHVYDVVAAGDWNFRNRHASPFVARDASIVPVKTLKVLDEGELLEQFDAWLSDGYEGLMVRNDTAPYEHKRSYSLQKVKQFDDAEFKIVGIEAGRGKMADKGIFVCETDDGTQFKVKMVGALDDLQRLLTHPEEYIGKLLTVKYQGITNESKVPRFPIGMRLRDDI